MSSNGLPDGDDELGRRLRALPTHANAANAAPAARATFDRAFGRSPSNDAQDARAFIGRALVPVGLVGIVGAYLFWAFNAAIALYN
jgi:hypothetical protein